MKTKKIIIGIKDKDKFIYFKKITINDYFKIDNLIRIIEIFLKHNKNYIEDEKSSE